MCEGPKNDLAIDYFTVVGLVTWLLNGGEVGVDLVLIQTSRFYCANQVAVMLNSLHLHERSVSKQGHLQPCLHSWSGN